MLDLKNITKTYIVKDAQAVEALKGVNLSFPNSGFVAILGQSGCGKTTLLNIIGGLDRYTEGDLIINNQSTKNYTNADWDLYRNKEIGIVFQSYNLIPHLSVLQNVALALRLSGVSTKEREEKATKALIQVGLEDQIKKSPNQLSGGQMQRVAIARALVNEPNVILADEPTGALDSKTSIQIMELLQEIAKEKLVIMVTHNEKLAKEYSTRIIQLSDGLVTSDNENKKGKGSKKIEEKKEEKIVFKQKQKHTSMSYPSALALSGKNLLTKKGKTIITSIASSFGIIGIGLVLALSNGFTNYIDRMERQALNTFPITIEKYSSTIEESDEAKQEQYPSESKVNVVEPVTSLFHVNKITKDYINYIESINTDKKQYATIRYNYSLGMKVIGSYKSGNNDYYKSISTTPMSYIDNLINSMASSYFTDSSMYWQPLPASEKEILEQYDILNPNGQLPDEDYDAKNDEIGLVLVVNSYNNLTTTVMDALGLDPTSNKSYTFDDILNLEFKYVSMDDFYSSSNTYIEEKAGLFFKDTIKMSDINNITSLLTSDEGDISMESITNLLDLPFQDDMQTAAINVGIKYQDELTKFFKVDRNNLSSLMNSQMTLKKFKEEVLRKENLQSDEDKKEFAIFLVNFFNDFARHNAVSKNLTRTLRSFDEPNSNRLKELYNDSTIGKKLKIKAILREKKGIDLGILHSGIYYPKPLTYQAFNDCDSVTQGKIAHDYKNHVFLGYTYNESMTSSEVRSDEKYRPLYEGITKLVTDLYSKEEFSNDEYEQMALDIIGTDKLYINFREIIGSLKTITANDYITRFNGLGSDVEFGPNKNFSNPLTYADYATSITIYPNSYEDKLYITEYLEKYNEGKNQADKIFLTDIGQAATQIIGTIVSVISGVLIAFASISLVVSSIMIAILIYSSVIERTKEIGILRSIGARKKDVGRLFHAEGMIIGLLSGTIGVALTYIISIPLSLILNAVFPQAELGMIAFLNPLHALILIVISVLLTFLASLLPSRYAANKDPVLCLRTE